MHSRRCSIVNCNYWCQYLVNWNTVPYCFLVKCGKQMFLSDKRCERIRHISQCPLLVSLSKYSSNERKFLTVHAAYRTLLQTSLYFNPSGSDLSAQLATEMEVVLSSLVIIMQT
jgi:hypothetical protein